ncbi:hypothetical protein Ahy_A01g004584 isoform B [Arachis hypogaea]|uniref:Uncharacterized protein n=1 Tax=Arachis hypogaea TaxID=3818 RepID=A0A445EWG8_ARAHY|nr:hypothetical protein Ahy_A01g004584 isoform B [Arachis hypogaea]
MVCRAFSGFFGCAPLVQKLLSICSISITCSDCFLLGAWLWLSSRKVSFGTNVLRKETGHSNSGLLWGINNQAFNIAPFYYKEKWNIYYELFSF